MRRLLREIAGLSANQWVTLISLLVLLNLVVMGGLLWAITSAVSPENVPFNQLILAQAPATRTPYPTFTVAPAQPTLTLLPSATNTGVPTWTPSITLTPTPSKTPTETATPTPTETPVVVQVRAQAPVATHTPTPSPTPNVDFAASVRQLTPCENQGKHHIFITVVDEFGNGIPGVDLLVTWVGGEATVSTGTKGENPGLTDFAMFKGTYHVQMVGVLSDIAGPITPDIPQDQLCEDNGNPVGNSLYHYSYEVIFRKVR